MRVLLSSEFGFLLEMVSELSVNRFLSVLFESVDLYGSGALVCLNFLIIQTNTVPSALFPCYRKM